MKQHFSTSWAEFKLNVSRHYRVSHESVSSCSLPSSSSSQNAVLSSRPVSGGADTHLDLWLFPTPPGLRRHRSAPPRSRSVPASSSVCWSLAADRPRPPPGSSDTAYRSGTGRSTDRQHSRQTARSSPSLELQTETQLLSEWTRREQFSQRWKCS